VCDPFSGPGTSSCAAEWLWRNPAEGVDTVLAGAHMEPTRPGTDSKFQDGDGSQRPEYAKARMVRTGTRKTVIQPWLPGRAIMVDLDPAMPGLYAERRDECFASLGESQDAPNGEPETPLFQEAANL
jgi:hypothetical protein